MNPAHYVFGEWDAPMTDDLPSGPTPVGRECAWCDEPIAEGDNGRVTPYLIEHRECSLRTVMGGIGHHVDHDRYCHGIGPDAGLSRRQSSLMVWDFFQQTRWHPDDGILGVWRQRVARAQEQALHANNQPNP